MSDKFMNKASRKSGGKAVKQISEDLLILLELLNLFKDFIESPKMSELLESGYEEYLRALGIEITAFYVNPPITRLSKFLRAFPVYDYVELKMDWFTTVVCSMPEKLALDIIKQCPAYERSGAKELLDFMKNDGFNLFDGLFIEDEEDEKQQSAVQNFYYCMNRFEELLVIYNLLHDALSVWNFSNSNAKNLNRSNNNTFMLLNTDESYRPFIRVELDEKFKTVFRLSESLELLNRLEIERIRICPKCYKFFWVGRKDLIACSPCSEKIRKKKWRDNNAKKQKSDFR